MSPLLHVPYVLAVCSRGRARWACPSTPRPWRTDADLTPDAPGMSPERASEESGSLQAVLDALDDRDCRRIVRTLEEPMTATEISDQCDLADSTTYRKLDRLIAADLVTDEPALAPGEGHRTRYRLAVQELTVRLTDDREFEVEAAERERTPDDRLADLWRQVGEQL